tara:strand:+ start:111 stop:215 length:105 start_codon:yes stop_codon:yes gene_type:complete
VEQEIPLSLLLLKEKMEEVEFVLVIQEQVVEEVL